MQNKKTILLLVISNGNFDINPSLNVDVGDLSDDLGRRVQVQDSLVDTHLETIVSVSTLTARRLSDHESKDLGGHAHRSSDLEITGNGLGLKFSAN